MSEFLLGIPKGYAQIVEALFDFGGGQIAKLAVGSAHCNKFSGLIN